MSTRLVVIAAALLLAAATSGFAHQQPMMLADADQAQSLPAIEPAPGQGLFQPLSSSPEAMAAAGMSTLVVQQQSAAIEIAERTGIRTNVIKRSRRVILDLNALAAMVPSNLPVMFKSGPIQGAPTRLALFGDADFMAQPISLDRSFEDYVVWNGTVLTPGGGTVSLVMHGAEVTGEIAAGGRIFKVRPSTIKSQPVHEIVEVDENFYPHGPIFERSLNLPSEAGTPSAPKSGIDSSNLPQGPSDTAPATAREMSQPAGDSGPYTIKALVAYTTAAAAAASLQGQDIKALVLSGMNVVSGVWSASGVNATLSPTIVQADPSLPDGSSALLGQHLEALDGSYLVAPGYALLRQQRDQIGASIVHLITAGAVNDPFCGIADIPGRPIGQAGAVYAYSAVQMPCLGTSDAHEIGHNMGLNHDRATDNITDQSVYNVGWVDQTTLNRDVMSYPQACNNRCALQRLYSSPLLTVAGAAFGVPAGGVNPADGVRAVNEDVPVISTYRGNGVNSPSANQGELAVALTAAAPSGSSTSQFAQPTNLCRASSTTDGAVWFTYTPSIAGTVALAISGLTANDYTCLYLGTPTGQATVNSAGTGTIAPSYYPYLYLNNQGASSMLLEAPATAGQPVYLAVNALAASTTPVAVTAASVVPQNGWWWDPNFGGIGFAIETNPPPTGQTAAHLFLAGFFYNDDGTPTWAVSSGSMTDAAHYSGSFLPYSGGRPYGSANVTAVQGASLGTITLSFSSPTAAAVSWPGGTLNLQRFSFDSTTTDRTKLTSLESGWYWVANDGGRGMFMEQQGSTLFVADFAYDSSGKATWQTATMTSVQNGQFQGPLIDYSGGTSVHSGFRSAAQRNSFGTDTIYSDFPSSGVYYPLVNTAAPKNFPQTYYTAPQIDSLLPSANNTLTFVRYRF